MTDGVLEAFELLFEEIQKHIDKIKTEIKAAVDISDYGRVQEYMEKIKKLEDFKEKLKDLQKEWENLYVPMPSSVGSKKEYTKEKEYIIPILESLVELGGSGSRKEVLQKVEEKMKGRFTAADCEKFPSNSEEAWRVYASRCRERLVEKGLLSKSSPKGIWEITEKGRNYLREVQKP
ncbi:MAG: winged helix-turn-helix domain-containing protein [Aquificaceae bacterium]